MVARLDPNNMDAQLKLATFLTLGRNTKEAREKVDLILRNEPSKPARTRKRPPLAI